MAVIWCRYAALLLAFNAALTSAGTGKVAKFIVNGTYFSPSDGYVQADAQSKMFLNCTAVNLSDSSIVHIRKIDLKNPQNVISISSNDELLINNHDSRFKNPVVLHGTTSDVKSYIVEVDNLAEDDTGNYTCHVGVRNVSFSVLVNVSAVPRFVCNKTVFVDRKSGKLSIECPLFAYNLQSIAAHWQCTNHAQVVLRLSGRNESTTSEIHVDVNYTLRLTPGDPNDGIPYKVTLTISPIEKATELFKTSYHLKAKGDKGEVDHEITFRDSLQPGPSHGVAAKPQAWSFAAHFLVAVVLTVVCGFL